MFRERVYGPPIHKNVIVRWKDVLKEGLPVEERNNLLKKYHQPQNCVFSEGPKINPEIKSASLINLEIKSVSLPVIDRDNRLVGKQDRVALSLAGLSILISSISNEETIDNMRFLEVLNDVCCLLFDIQRDESMIRKLNNFN